MLTSSAPRGLKAFLFVLTFLLGAAFLASVARSPVSVTKISARQFSNTSPHAANVAVPFGSNDGLLFSAVRPVGQNLTKSSDGFQGSRVSKRAGVPSWEEAVNAGTETMAKLQGIRDQSLVNNLQQIYDAGWSILDPIAAEELIEPDVFAELGGPYDDLNIDWRNGRDVEAIQDKRFDNCFHRDNAATGARFINIYNVPDRAIIGQYNFGPAYKLNERETQNPAAAQGLPPIKERIPNVWRYSDIMWEIWTNLAEDNAPNLKYIFKHHIITASTQYIMEQAAGVGHNALDEDWPGLVYFPDDIEFLALLGTPHGKGIAHMLVDRPYGLRGKNIVSITIFTTYEDYNLLFTLTN